MTPPVFDAPAQLYTFAWTALLVISAFYGIAGVALRWRPQRTIKVTRYEPPQGISPGVAAFLFQSGRCERSFAAALISLAAKGYLTIRQKAAWFTLEKLREPDVLPKEESAALATLFPDARPDYSFDGRDSVRLFEAYRHFGGVVQSVATPTLMSTHVVVWLVGFVSSLAVLQPIVLSMPRLGNGMSPASVGFLSIMIIAGGSCFVAALRAWPATLRKLFSFVPGDRRPSLPLGLNDAIPILLTGSALVGFGCLVVLTTAKFAGILTAAVAINALARPLLNAPTRAGRRVLTELQEFREFLSRTDTDRLTYQNKPGETPRTLEQYTPYAVALGVEHGWGKEFAGNLLELLQMNQAYSRSRTFPKPESATEELSLFNRRK